MGKREVQCGRSDGCRGDQNHSQGGVRGEEEEQRGKLREVTRNI